MHVLGLEILNVRLNFNASQYDLRTKHNYNQVHKSLLCGCSELSLTFAQRATTILMKPGEDALCPSSGVAGEPWAGGLLTWARCAWKDRSLWGWRKAPLGQRFLDRGRSVRRGERNKVAATVHMAPKTGTLRTLTVFPMGKDLGSLEQQWVCIHRRYVRRRACWSGLHETSILYERHYSYH